MRLLSSHAKPQYADKTWAVLRDAICQINRRDASGLSFEELYRNAYNMVLHKFGDKLYAGLINTITQHLQNVAAHVQAGPNHSGRHRALPPAHGTVLLRAARGGHHRGDEDHLRPRVVYL